MQPRVESVLAVSQQDRRSGKPTDLNISLRELLIVGSHLHYMGERLDALFGAAQKGSHATVTKEEADRCVIYTYLLVADILSLHPQQTPTPQFGQVDEVLLETLGEAQELPDELFA